MENSNYELDLLGLGAVRMPEETKREVLKGLANSMLTRSQKHLLVKQKELGEQSKANIKSRRASFGDAVLFVNHKIAGATGIEELLDNKLNASEGITNFEEGKVPAGMDLSVDEVIVKMANHADNVKPDAQIYYNTGAAADFASSIVNAQLDVTADGEKVIDSLPIASGFGISEAASGEVRIPLKALKILKSGVKVQITLRKPDGGLLLANHNFVSVALSGSIIK